MILALSGTDAQLLSHCRHRYSGSRDVIVQPGREWAEPWSVLRRILPTLRELHGSEPVERAVRQHSVAASFVLPGRLKTLEPPATLRRKQLEARLASHMTHNEIVQEQLFEEVAALFHDLLAPDLRLVLPNIARLDPSSLVLLRTTYRLFSDTSPSLVIGYDPATSVEVDEDGILWDFSPLMLKAFVHGFHTLDGFRVQTVSGEEAVLSEEGSAPSSTQRRVDPLDSDLEGRAWRSLQELGETSGAAVPETTRDLVLEAIDRCFESYAFRPLMTLGLELLRRGASLAADDEARVRTMVALGAHNRQFLSRGNLRLARFLEGHYRRALELETDPLRRICLLYRLTVAVGRRQGRIEPALELADRGLESFEGAALPAEEAVMQEAWLRNIRAFLLMRQKKLDAAFEEERRAVALLARCEELSEVLRTDARLSRAVVADNLAELAILVHDDDHRSRWHRATQELVGDWLDLGHLTSRMWMTFHRAGLRLDEARKHAETGLRESRRKKIYVLEYLYLANLADIEYRLGDPARALALYDEVLPFRDLLADGVDVRLPVEAASIAAALRLGDAPRAKTELRRLSEDRRDASLEERAELEATAGWIAALANEPEAAEERINQAIELAVESGARDALLRVALLAGRTCRHLGREADARSAYLQALEISEAGSRDEPVAPADLAEARLGLWTCGAGGFEHLRILVSLYPEALREDPEAWWRLGELLEGLRKAGEAGKEWLADADLATSLATIRRAASQREDCRERLAALGSIFPLSAAAEDVRNAGNASNAASATDVDARGEAPVTAASAGSASVP